MYYVYLLQSVINSERRYIGYTTNLHSRVKAHNSGQSKHTAKHKPWKLISYHVFANKQVAREFEHYLKTGSGQAFANRRLW